MEFLLSQCISKIAIPSEKCLDTTNTECGTSSNNSHRIPSLRIFFLVGIEPMITLMDTYIHITENNFETLTIFIRKKEKYP